MTDIKIANQLRQIILNSIKFNIVYLTAGITVMMLNLVSVFPQILNSNYVLNLMYATIMLPPAVMILIAQIMNVCLFFRIEDGELKQQHREISKTTLTICRSVCLLMTLAVGAVLIEFDIQLSKPVMDWLFGYVVLWMAAEMVFVEMWIWSQNFFWDFLSRNASKKTR